MLVLQFELPMPEGYVAAELARVAKISVSLASEKKAAETCSLFFWTFFLVKHNFCKR